VVITPKTLLGHTHPGICILHRKLRIRIATGCPLLMECSQRRFPLRHQLTLKSTVLRRQCRGECGWRCDCSVVRPRPLRTLQRAGGSTLPLARGAALGHGSQDDLNVITQPSVIRRWGSPGWGSTPEPFKRIQGSFKKTPGSFWKTRGPLKGRPGSFKKAPGSFFQDPGIL